MARFTSVFVATAAAFLFVAMPTHGEEPAQLPAGALSRIGKPYLRHPGAAISVAFAPDGKSFASVGNPEIRGQNDRLAVLWDFATGNEIRRFRGHADGVQSLAFSANGEFLVTGGLDKTVRLWETATGKEVRQFKGSTGAVLAVAYSTDGNYVASQGQDQLVRLWNARTGDPVRQWLGNKSTGTSNVAFTPDSKLIASVAADFSIRLRDVGSGDEIRKFVGHTMDCESLDFSRDGKWLASVSLDKTVRLWNVETGKEERQFTGLPQHIATVRISPDGKLVAAGGLGRVVYIWELATGKFRGGCGGNQASVSEVAFSPDSKSLASAGHDGTIRLWDVATTRPLPQSGNGIAAATISADGKRMLTLGNDGSLREWDPSNGRELLSLPPIEYRVTAMAYSIDGKSVITNGLTSRLNVLPARDGQVQTLPGTQDAMIRRIVLNADGSKAASLDLNRFRVWDAKTGLPTTAAARFAEETAKTGQANALAFAPAGGLLASGGMDGLIRIWDVASGQPIRVLGEALKMRSPIMAIAYSPDGRTLSAIATDQTIRFWETASGAARGLWQLPVPFGSLAFVSGGRMVAVGGSDGVVRFLDLYSGDELTKRTGHTAAVTDLIAANGGDLLVSFSSRSTIFVGPASAISNFGDGTAVIWDLSDRKSLSRAAKPPVAADLDGLWTDLVGNNAIKAFTAIGRLAAAPDLAIPLLKDRLPPAVQSSSVDLEKLIAELDHDEYIRRERASADLVRAGSQALAPVTAALANTKSREVRRRAIAIIESLKTAPISPESIGAARGVELLERIGTPAAAGLLAEWSRGPANSPLTAEARTEVPHARSDRRNGV